MTLDHYDTLGVAPNAEPAVIRAAYLALMRQYHPDRNTSPAAVARAQAIIAAFKVVGDFDQRNEYDWDRRRAREAAASLATKRPRRFGAGAVTAGAIGLTAIGAFSMIPTPQPEAEPRALTTEARQSPAGKVRQSVAARTAPAPRPERIAARTPVAEPQRVSISLPAALKAPRPAPVASRTEQARVAKIEPERLGPAKTKAAPTVAMVAPVPLAKRAPIPAPEKPTRASAKPVRQASPAATDLATLDQFVMSFYGQSWRFGDPPKRAVLEQTRASFVARRGACTADSCKRAAYLKLMRDVSAIVETGHPTAR